MKFKLPAIPEVTNCVKSFGLVEFPMTKPVLSVMTPPSPCWQFTDYLIARLPPNRRLESKTMSLLPHSIDQSMS